MADSKTEQVTTFQAALDNGHREGFMTYAEHTYSIYEIWLYASVLGYEGSFTALGEWVAKHYPKLNKRE